jgi:hypothetical protein
MSKPRFALAAPFAATKAANGSTRAGTTTTTTRKTTA